MPNYKVYKYSRETYSKWPEYKEHVKWLRNYQCNLCFICMLALQEKTHIDHIKPLYNGGLNKLNNLALTHPRCNITKGVSELLGKEEVHWRKKKLWEIKQGIEFYKRQEKGIRPKKNQEPLIAQAVDYLGLDYLKNYE